MVHFLCLSNYYKVQELVQGVRDTYFIAFISWGMCDLLGISDRTMQ